MVRGNELIAKWAIPARQARFHRDGVFYEHLTNFPAALCDPKGYVVFETEEDYKTCPDLKLGQKVNVSRGISSLLGYRQVDDPLE